MHTINIGLLTYDSVAIRLSCSSCLLFVTDALFIFPMFNFSFTVSVHFVRVGNGTLVVIDSISLRTLSESVYTFVFKFSDVHVSLSFIQISIMA